MPIVAALLIIAAVIYGAVMLYMTVAADFGQAAGAAAVVLAALLLALFVKMLISRYRTIHGVTIKGKRVLAMKDAWGQIHIDAIQKRGELHLHGKPAYFIFADIASAQAVAHGKTWTLELRLNHNSQALWIIPMSNGKQARRWAKIVTLAATQEL